MLRLTAYRIPKTSCSSNVTMHSQHNTCMHAMWSMLGIDMTIMVSITNSKWCKSVELRAAGWRWHCTQSQGHVPFTWYFQSPAEWCTRCVVHMLWEYAPSSLVFVSAVQCFWFDLNAAFRRRLYTKNVVLPQYDNALATQLYVRSVV